MKLRNVLSAFVAVGTMALMAVGVQAATYSAGAVSPEAGVASVPVVVTPDAGASESVNGYVMTLTYDKTKVTPKVAAADATGADCYAKAGTSFANGVLVSDIVKEEGNNVTLAVAWASATPVTVTEAANMATVDFAVADTATGDIPITVSLAALTSDGSALTDVTTVTTSNGEITINGGNFLRGDANGDGVVDISDTSMISQYLVGLVTIDDKYKLQADANNDGNIDISDASMISQFLVGLATIPE